MEKRIIPASELVLNSKGAVYHLDLLPHQVADTIFLVGDPGRVGMMSEFFTEIEHIAENREFVTHTGHFNGHRVSVISTGIGTDNIDIVVNELDALVNIDLEERTEKPVSNTLKLIRIGTSGSLHGDIPPGAVILSEISGGLDNLLNYYRDGDAFAEEGISEHFMNHMGWQYPRNKTLFYRCSEHLSEMLGDMRLVKGITLSAPGFYGPQGRSLRSRISDSAMIDKLNKFRFAGLRICNFEMESSALYGLSRLLGHESLTICLALSNRQTGEFLPDYHHVMKQLLGDTLQMICNNHEG